jgi:hypothetical protein
MGATQFKCTPWVQQSALFDRRVESARRNAVSVHPMGATLIGPISSVLLIGATQFKCTFSVQP